MYITMVTVILHAHYINSSKKIGYLDYVTFHVVFKYFSNNYFFLHCQCINSLANVLTCINLSSSFTMVMQRFRVEYIIHIGPGPAFSYKLRFIVGF